MAENGQGLIQRPLESETAKPFRFTPRVLTEIDTVGKNRKGPIASHIGPTLIQDHCVLHSVEPESTSVQPKDQTAFSAINGQCQDAADDKDVYVTNAQARQSKKSPSPSRVQKSPNKPHPMHIQINDSAKLPSPCRVQKSPKGSRPSSIQVNHTSKSPSPCHMQKSPSRPVQRNPISTHTSGRRSCKGSRTLSQQLQDMLQDEVNVRTQQHREKYEDALTRATAELRRLSKENHELVMLQEALAQERAEARTLREQLDKLKTKAIGFQKNLKGVFGDMNYLKTKRTDLEEHVKQLSQELGDVKGNGIREQIKLEQYLSQIKKLQAESKRMTDDLRKAEYLEHELHIQLQSKREIEHQCYVKSAELTEERNSKVRLEQQLSKVNETNHQLSCNYSSIASKLESQQSIEENVLARLQQQDQLLRDGLKATFSDVEERLRTFTNVNSAPRPIELTLQTQVETLVKSIETTKVAEGNNVEEQRAEDAKVVAELLLKRLDAFRDDMIQIQQTEQLKAVNEVLQAEKRDLGHRFDQLLDFRLQSVKHLSRLSTPSVDVYDSAHEQQDDENRQAMPISNIAANSSQTKSHTIENSFPGPQPQPLEPPQDLVSKWAFVDGMASQKEQEDEDLVLDACDMISHNGTPISTAAHPNAVIATPRLVTSNNQANMKTKIARSRHSNGSVVNSDEVEDPEGSTGVRTPTQSSIRHNTEQQQGVHEGLGALDGVQSPPQMSRRKDSRRNAKMPLIRNSPVKAPGLSSQVRKMKTKKPTRAEKAAYFKNGGK
ncbi:MAG: hypothetical protein Q9159_001433 [Coniocarpon cinnabarinum]